MDFVELCLHRDAYRAALGQPQLLPSPCQLTVVPNGQTGDLDQVPFGRVTLLRSFPRVYGLRVQAPDGREVWAQARLPRGYYQMSGSYQAQLRWWLSLLLFYSLLLVSTTSLVRRLRGRLQELRALANRLALGQLEETMAGQPGDSAEFSQLRRQLLAMAESLLRRARILESKRTLLQEAGAERNRRLAEVSHDLRTPLTSILGFAQLYREEGCGQLEVVELEGQALLQRVGQWLESCRLESGALDIRLISTELHDLLEEGFHLAQQRQLLEAEVVLPAKSPLISADPFLLPRVLAHLLLELNCQRVQIRLDRPCLQLIGEEPRPQPKDPTLLSLDGCRQLLQLHGIGLERQPDRFVLRWEEPWKT